MLDYFNDKNNKEKINKFGEYCQIMIISSAGAEGDFINMCPTIISLNHIGIM